MNKLILYFDGTCNLCNRSVQFVLRHNSRKDIHFAPLQSPLGAAAKAEVAKRYGRVPDSIIFQIDNDYFIESDAALRLTQHLDGIWRVLYVLHHLPKRLRDWVYRLVAKRRYAWFGKRDSCLMPTEELRQRFLP
ncbi:MAG: DUF393 domain-containing protein [Bacteroidetes bacterium]|nr:DUF393 domain-containing protein [Bacteroidota bacterium]